MAIPPYSAEPAAIISPAENVNAAEVESTSGLLSAYVSSRQSMAYYERLGSYTGPDADAATVVSQRYRTEQGRFQEFASQALTTLTTRINQERVAAHTGEGEPSLVTAADIEKAVSDKLAANPETSRVDVYKAVNESLSLGVNDLSSGNEAAMRKAEEEQKNLRDMLEALKGPNPPGLFDSLIAGLGSVRFGPFKDADDIVRDLPASIQGQFAALQERGHLNFQPVPGGDPARFPPVTDQAAERELQASLVTALSTYYASVNTVRRTAAAGVYGAMDYGGAVLNTAGATASAAINGATTDPNPGSSPDGIIGVAGDAVTRAGNAVSDGFNTARKTGSAEFAQADASYDRTMRTHDLTQIAHAMIYGGNDVQLSNVAAPEAVLATLTPEAKARIEADRASRDQSTFPLMEGISMLDIARAMRPETRAAYFSVTGAVLRAGQTSITFEDIPGQTYAVVPLYEDLHQRGLGAWAAYGAPRDLDPKMAAKHADLIRSNGTDAPRDVASEARAAALPARLPVSDTDTPAARPVYTEARERERALSS